MHSNIIEQLLVMLNLRVSPLNQLIKVNLLAAPIPDASLNNLRLGVHSRGKNCGEQRALNPANKAARRIFAPIAYLQLVRTSVLSLLTLLATLTHTPNLNLIAGLVWIGDGDGGRGSSCCCCGGAPCASSDDDA